MWTGGQSERPVSLGYRHTSLGISQVVHFHTHTPTQGIWRIFPPGLFPQLSTMVGLHNMYYTHLLLRTTTIIVPFVTPWCIYTEHSPADNRPDTKKVARSLVDRATPFLPKSATENQGCLPAISPSRTCASCWTWVPSSCASDSQIALASAALPAAIRLRAWDA